MSQEQDDSLYRAFDEHAIGALFNARAAVSEHGGTAVDVGHILVGVLQATPAGTSDYLQDPGGAQALSECVMRLIVGPRLSTVDEELPLTPAARRAMENAAAIARQLGHDRIRLGHLLIAILDETELPTAACLRAAGVSRDHIVGGLTGRG